MWCYEAFKISPLGLRATEVKLYSQCSELVLSLFRVIFFFLVSKSLSF